MSLTVFRTRGACGDDYGVVVLRQRRFDVFNELGSRPPIVFVQGCEVLASFPGNSA